MEKNTSLNHICPSTSSSTPSSSSNPPPPPYSSSSSIYSQDHTYAPPIPPFSSSNSSLTSISPPPSTSTSSSFLNGVEEEEEEEEREGRATRRRKRMLTHKETRQRRRKPRPGESWCPVCGVTLRPGELEAHLTHELDKLARLPHARPPSQRTTPPAPNVAAAAATPASTPAATPATPSTSSTSHANGEGRGGTARGAGRGSDWEKYERIKTNREGRLGRRRGRGGGGEEVICPVCGFKEGDAAPHEDIHQHIDNCLRRVEEEGEDEVEVEVEEYEWCGETRIRATQMLRAEGQLHALGTRVEHGSEDEVVEVCEDDEEAQYGASQFTVADLPPRTPPPATHPDTHHHPASSTDPTQAHADQEQTAGGTKNGAKARDAEENAENRENRSRETQNRGNRNREIGETGGNGCQVPSSSSSAASSSSSGLGDDGGGGALVEALRARVRELESACARPHHSTCRVCHDDYDSPLVSISCWHVHCKACWLSALASRRLCPQCSVITAPSDLRKIYL